MQFAVDSQDVTPVNKDCRMYCKSNKIFSLDLAINMHENLK